MFKVGVPDPRVASAWYSGITSAGARKRHVARSVQYSKYKRGVWGSMYAKINRQRTSAPQRDGDARSIIPRIAATDPLSTTQVYFRNVIEFVRTSMI
jgi:hypothetical protein